MHYRFIEHHLDGVRYPWGLLPAEYLFFRWFGELSAWFPAIFCGAFGWSFFRPGSTRYLLPICTTAFLIFTVAYACYAVLIVAILLANRNA